MKFFNIQNTVGIIIISVLIVIFLFLITWDYIWEEEYLGKWASVITIISIGIAPAWYFWTKYQNEKDKRTQASKNLHTELIDTLESLDRVKYFDDADSFHTDDNREIFYMNRNFNHDFYDSLIFSGKINFLRPELQQQVQNIFNQIKTHNDYLDLCKKIQDTESTQEIPKKAYRYYEWMDENEVKLEKDIPIMLKKLKKDFNI